MYKPHVPYGHDLVVCMGKLFSHAVNYNRLNCHVNIITTKVTLIIVIILVLYIKDLELRYHGIEKLMTVS